MKNPERQEPNDEAIEAIGRLADAVRALRAARVIRSNRITGDLGEWYVEQLYCGTRTPSQTQKGFDVMLPDTNERLQVKAQTFDPNNQWNYLDSDTALFDRIVIVILTPSFKLHHLYEMKVAELRGVVRIGKEHRPRYYWKDLVRIDPQTLPGFDKLLGLIE